MQVLSLSLISLYLFVVQMLVVQAVRPDRLQSAMGVFAAKALGKCMSHIPFGSNKDWFVTEMNILHTLEKHGFR